MRRSPIVEELEAKHGKPIQRIVAEAYTQYGTIEKAAEALGVNRATFGGWVIRHHITVRKIAIAS